MTSQLRQAESRTGELRVVELIATGAPLDEVLALIIQMSEDRLEGMLAAVIVLDEAGRRMRTAAALSLPAEFCRLLDGQPIGRQGGPCGAAVYHREPVIVADLQQDPAWANYAEEARRFGLRACWATPMISPDGTLLGAFVMHSRVPRSPTRTELELVEAATHLAAAASNSSRAILIGSPDGRLQMPDLLRLGPGDHTRDHRDRVLGHPVLRLHGVPDPDGGRDGLVAR